MLKEAAGTGVAGLTVMGPKPVPYETKESGGPKMWPIRQFFFFFCERAGGFNRVGENYFDSCSRGKVVGSRKRRPSMPHGGVFWRKDSFWLWSVFLVTRLCVFVVGWFGTGCRR